MTSSAVRRAFLTFLGLQALASAFGSPPIEVSLRSSWQKVPLLLEVLESVSWEYPDAFFPLLEGLTSKPIPDSPEGIHEFALQTASEFGYFEEPGSLAAVQLHLALHDASPKIQAFYQFYADQYSGENITCGSWVDWYGETVCDLDTLIHLTAHDYIDPYKPEVIMPLIRPQLLAFDHVNPSPSLTLERPLRTAILYGHPESQNFRDLHSYLLRSSSGPGARLEYVFRHIPSTSSERQVLAGYGVALDLKKMDYLALDDRNSHSSDSSESSPSEVTAEVAEDPILAYLHTFPENDTLDANIALTEEELNEIGFQAAQLITATDPLRSFVQLSQNFPRYATQLARRVVLGEALVEEILQNHVSAHPGMSQAWVNGFTIPDGDMSPLGLLKIINRERSVMRSMTTLGLNSSQAVDILTHPIIYSAQTEPSVLDGIFDASDRIEGGVTIVWWNDLAKDSRYQRWSPELSTIVRPMFPGSFPMVKINLFNVVLVMDLSKTSSLNFIAGALNNIINRQFPIRFGIMPVVDSADGMKMTRLFYFLIDNYGRAKTMNYILRICQVQLPIELMTPKVDWRLAKSEFETLVYQFPVEGGSAPDFDAIINGEMHDADERLERAAAYARRLDTTSSSSESGHAFVNGKHFVMDDDFLRYMQMEVSQHLQHLQEKVFHGELADADVPRMETYFYDLPSTSSKRNRYIHPGSQQGSIKIVNLPEIFLKVGHTTSSQAFLYPDGAAAVPLSAFVVADLDSEVGLAIVKEAVESLTPDSTSRLTFIHNPTTARIQSETHGPVSSSISYLITHNFLGKLSPQDFLEFLDLAIANKFDLSNRSTFIESPIYEFLHDRNVAAEFGFDPEIYRVFMRTSRLVAREIGVDPGQTVVVVNGRIVGPLSENSFTSDDFEAVYAFELRKRVGPVIGAFTAMNLTAAEYDRFTFSSMVSMASSVVSAVQLPDPSEQGLFNTFQRPRQRNYKLLQKSYSMFEYGDPETATFHFGVVIDPLSEVAQRWSVLIEWLSNMPGVYIEVYLNPGRYTDVPLKRFYRYSLPYDMSFDEKGAEINAKTVFNDLPVDPIYTLAMDVPPSWLVRPREALHDLDNIQLSHLSPADRISGIEAIFDLDYIVIEGHARDSLTNAPPRGLQLQLSTIDGSPVDDTLVVANWGYFQFKAKPGVFSLDIREGRGRDIYSMESVGNEGWHSPRVEEVGSTVTLTDFGGMTLYPRVRRRPGQERADVLDEFIMTGKDDKNIFSNISSRVASWFAPKTESAETGLVKKQADINIFTVASGLLYERFASIMILSVLKNTNSTVKFWFIENFLSPSFLEFIPHFAEAYGFEYELVTYKWPSWLRAQKEKQRIIWAYKILFLDVLFPMDLKKVIFVDADQIVRTDLKELVDLDLHGAPYGYTPMGDDNKEMEGFRFWKTGYWKDFLQGRPYHISALYVVDLMRFRQVAAGDMLRGQYQQLSADPNSLANLDQDLPNNLQREVPIFSLPEDWLWCETWCSQDRLHRAKTIDLCQNPLTKEPKLDRARKIPEWSEYDSEIARFARKLADAGKVKSHVAAADANALASAGSSDKSSEQSESEDTGRDGEQPEDGRISTEREPGMTAGTTSPLPSHTKDEL